MKPRVAKQHPFNVDWANGLIRDCPRAGVNFFLKQLGSNAVYTASNLQLHPSAIHDPKFWVPLRGSKHYSHPITHPKGGDWNEWQPRLRVRNFPVV